MQQHPARIFFIINSLLLVLIDTLAISVAAKDHSWTALALLFYAPAYNAPFILTALIGLLIIRYRHKERSYTTYWLITFLLPFMTTAITMVWILSMPMHGC